MCLRRKESDEDLSFVDVTVAWVYKSSKRPRANWRLFLSAQDSIGSLEAATHIMLVEDDVSLARWISDYLSTQGFYCDLGN